MISICEALKSKCPNIVLSTISCPIAISEASPALLAEINSVCKNIQDNLEVSQINKIPTIADSRTAYKALGKDPSRYRLSAEALTRRIVKGKGLYHINNVVDIINLTSIQSGFSIGGYNFEKIEGKITFCIGGQEPYDAIGRGNLNIEFLPVFKDEKGTFGSPTSDSTRTMITNDTKHLLMVIISFGGNDELQTATDLAVRLLENHANATNIEVRMIE